MNFLLRLVVVGFCYRVAQTFCGSFILRIGDFLWFAETNFCGSR